LLFLLPLTLHPWTEQLQAKHTQARTNGTHNTTNNGIQTREKTLRKNSDCWTREAVGQGDRATTAQSEEAPQQPQNSRRTQWSLTRSYGQNGDDGYARSPASRPKMVRMQGPSPTVRENGPVQRRDAGTA